VSRLLRELKMMPWRFAVCSLDDFYHLIVRKDVDI